MSNINKWLNEDENDIFLGSPKSKFFDITKLANSEIVENEIDKIIEKYAIMELLLSKEHKDDFDINKMLKQYILENLDEVEQMKKGLYIEFTGDIVSRLDS